MGWQVTPYTFPLAAAAIFAGFLAGTTYRNRETRGAVPLVVVLLATTIWCLCDAVGVSSTERAVKLLASDLSFFGQVGVTAGVFLFVAAYTNREHWLRPRRVAAVSLIHVLTLAVVWLPPLSDLLVLGTTMTEGTAYVYMRIQWGPWNAVHTAYSYLLLLGATWMLVDKLRQTGDVRTYRGQTVAILVAMVVPWGLSVAYHLRLTQVDLTALGFTVTGAMVAIALFQYRILDVVPIARSTAIDNINQGYVVLDPSDTVVDANDTAAVLLNSDKSSLVGQQADEVFGDYPTALDRFELARDTREQVTLRVDGERRYYDVDISPIVDRRDRYTGRVVLFQDVTEREQHKRRLERHRNQLESQNERLEEFASIVAHDLRNPLNVFTGHLELLRESHESERVDRMESTVDRMEAIIDDVLQMARQGQSVEETESVDLAAACADAWENVDTADASLEIRTDRTVEADRNRLLRVLENLFTNAVDHGGPTVAVTVGDLEDGFYVQDDGPGVPDGDRDAILEKGFTTAPDGTGFGLAIVKTAVEAHGWDIVVTDGVPDEGTDEDGDVGDSTESAGPGARFEITGLQRPVGQETTD